MVWSPLGGFIPGVLDIERVADAQHDPEEVLVVQRFELVGEFLEVRRIAYAVHGPVKARPDLKKAFQSKGVKQAEYLGFIAGVDENLKRMLDLLDDPNGDGDRSDSVAKNTVVFFTSDNGGTHAHNLPLKGTGSSR